MRTRCTPGSFPPPAYPVHRALALALALAGCTAPAAGPGTAAPPGPVAAAALPDLPRTSDPEVIVPAIREVQDAADAAASAWPGFHLRHHRMTAAFLPGGPVYRIGDRYPSERYRWLDEERLIAIAEAPVPEPPALRLVPIARAARQGREAVVYLDGGEGVAYFREALVRAAFVAHQEWSRAADPSRFQPPPGSAPPRQSDEARALDMLENIHIARALFTSEPGEARREALTAAAVREHRCRIEGEEACAHRRAMETREGTAVYVAVAALSREEIAAVAEPWRTAIKRLYAPAQAHSALPGRAYEHRGHAWLLALERFAPPGWQALVERSAPDPVLASVLGLQDASTDSLVAAAMERQRRATDPADTVLARRQREMSDSILAAGRERVGQRFRIHFGPHVAVTSARLQRPDGGVERRYTVGRGYISLHGFVREGFAPGVFAILPVAGRTALVDGRPIPLDRPGGEADGEVVIDYPEISLRLEHALLRVYADSVSIRIR